jgi:hypothetical protein
VLDGPAVGGLYPTVVRSDANLSSPGQIPTLDSQDHNAAVLKPGGHDVAARNGSAKRVVGSDDAEAMQGAKDEGEKQAIWNRSRMDLIAGYEKDKQELAEHFGGRMHYLIGEYKRRKLLSDSDAHLLEWQLGSKFWIAEAATTLDALARRLWGPSVTATASVTLLLDHQTSLSGA